jgi:hypothetical protein
MGGLSFEHIYDENLIQDPFKRDIFLLVNGVYMFNVPCEIIYDIPIHTPDEYQGFAIQFITRLCGVKFKTLLEDQIAQLKFFVKTFTIGKNLTDKFWIH